MLLLNAWQSGVPTKRGVQMAVLTKGQWCKWCWQKDVFVKVAEKIGAGKFSFTRK